MVYVRGKSHFDEDGTQNYSVFQPLFRYFKVNSIINVIDYVLSWQSKGLSNKSIKKISTSDNSLAPSLNYYGTKIRVKFTGSWLKQSNISCTHEKVVNIYIAYELGASSSNFSDPTLKNWSSFSFPGGVFGQNIIIFGVDMSSSPHIDNKGKVF